MSCAATRRRREPAEAEQPGLRLHALCPAGQGSCCLRTGEPPALGTDPSVFPATQWESQRQLPRALGLATELTSGHRARGLAGEPLGNAMTEGPGSWERGWQTLGGFLSRPSHLASTLLLTITHSQLWSSPNYTINTLRLWGWNSADLRDRTEGRVCWQEAKGWVDHLEGIREATPMPESSPLPSRFSTLIDTLPTSILDTLLLIFPTSYLGGCVLIIPIFFFF